MQNLMVAMTEISTYAWCAGSLVLVWLSWPVRSNGRLPGLSVLAWGLCITAFVMLLFDWVYMDRWLTIEQYSVLRRMVGRFGIGCAVMAAVLDLLYGRWNTRLDTE